MEYKAPGTGCMGYDTKFKIFSLEDKFKVCSLTKGNLYQILQNSRVMCL